MLYALVRAGASGAVVRTHDGRVQQVLGGRMEYEVAGAPGSSGTSFPAALLGDDKVWQRAWRMGQALGMGCACCADGRGA